MYGVMQSYFPAGFCTGWFSAGLRNSDPDARLTHIWEVDSRGYPSIACCGIDTQLRSLNRQAAGVALELVDCLQCLRDWPVIHGMVLEERVKEWCFAATHPKGHYIGDQVDPTVARCLS